jgi:hypothetical protein
MKIILMTIVLLFSSSLCAKLQAPIQLQQQMVIKQEDGSIAVGWRLHLPADVDRIEIVISVGDNAELLSQKRLVLLAEQQRFVEFIAELIPMDGRSIAINLTAEYQHNGNNLVLDLYDIVILSDRSIEESQTEQQAFEQYDAEESYR